MLEQESKSLFELFGSVSNQLDILHCAALVNSLQQQRTSGIRCDFIIQLKSTGGNKVFNAHKCILSTVCESIGITDSTVNGMELDTSEYVLESILDFVYTGKIIALQAMGKEEVKQIWRIGEYLKAKPLLHYLFRERPDVRPASPVNDQPLHSTTQKHCSDETESDPSSYSLTPSSSNLMIKNDNELESTQSNKQFSSSLPPSEVVKIEQTLICEEKDAFPSNYVNGKGLDEPISMMDCHRIEDEHLSSPRVEHCGDHLSPPTEQSRDQSICSKPTDVPPTLDTTLKLRNNLLQKLNGEQTSLTKTAIVSTRQVNTKRLKYTSKSHSHGSSAMPQHEEQDVELLRELKYLAPDAGIWNLLTDI